MRGLRGASQEELEGKETHTWKREVEEIHGKLGLRQVFSCPTY